MIFDAATLYFRAFHGLPSSLRSPDGRPVNAVRGFLDSVARLVEQYRPDQLAFAWDNDWRPQWRVDLVPSYKTHRLADDAAAGATSSGELASTGGLAEEGPEGLAEQVLIIRDALAALGLTIVGVDGYEADDVCGSLSAQCGIDNLVVTGDRDLFQLAHGNCRVVYIGKGVAKHDLVDESWLVATAGVLPQRYVDYAVLRGDASDGLPGVKGIGTKTAAQLVSDHEDLEAMLAAAGDPDSGMSSSVAKKLLAASGYLAPARQVVQVVTDLDVRGNEFHVTSSNIDHSECERLATEHGLRSSMDRIWAALRSVAVD